MEEDLYCRKYNVLCRSLAPLAKLTLGSWCFTLPFTCDFSWFHVWSLYSGLDSVVFFYLALLVTIDIGAVTFCKCFNLNLWHLCRYANHVWLHQPFANFTGQLQYLYGPFVHFYFYSLCLHPENPQTASRGGGLSCYPHFFLSLLLVKLSAGEDRPTCTSCCSRFLKSYAKRTNSTLGYRREGGQWLFHAVSCKPHPGRTLLSVWVCLCSRGQTWVGRSGIWRFERATTSYLPGNFSLSCIQIQVTNR